jgi:hypothetical protein
VSVRVRLQGQKDEELSAAHRREATLRAEIDAARSEAETAASQRRVAEAAADNAAAVRAELDAARRDVERLQEAAAAAAEVPELQRRLLHALELGDRERVRAWTRMPVPLMTSSGIPSI